MAEPATVRSCVLHEDCDAAERTILLDAERRVVKAAIELSSTCHGRVFDMLAFERLLDNTRTLVMYRQQISGVHA